MKHRNLLAVMVVFVVALSLVVPISAQGGDGDEITFTFDDPDLQARADLALAYVDCLNAGDIECLFPFARSKTFAFRRKALAS